MNTTRNQRGGFYRPGALVVGAICGLEIIPQLTAYLSTPTLLLAAALVVAAGFVRYRPDLACLVAFWSIALLDVLTYTLGSPEALLLSAGLVVALPFFLALWGSKRQILRGVIAVVVVYPIIIIADPVSSVEAVGGGVLLMLSGALGALVRALRVNRVQRVEGAIMAEREAWARELHDTVGHRMSAITITAQAGLVHADADDRPAVTEALTTIKDEAASGLRELRFMLDALRDGDDDDQQITPTKGIADLHELATALDADVVFSVDSQVTDVTSTVDAAVYRLVQESLTNVRRHARGVTRVEVRVDAKGANVVVQVRDDGDSTSSWGKGQGYGLVGMSERVALLGGRIDYGPAPDGGWLVRAEIPRKGR